MDIICGYCFDRIGAEDFLECEECEQYVHVHCLRRPGTPGDFVGDVFFKFTCLSCTSDNREVFERIKLPWTMMIVLAIYNLSKKSQGTSRRGYFHWRSHIASFIDRNWGNLMDPAVKKRKNWIGTISGTLSHNSQSLFISGMESFNEAGWWKLRHKKNPKQYYEYIQWIRREKGATEQVPSNDIISEPTSQGSCSSDSGDEGRSSQAMDIDDQKELDSCRRTLPFMGKRQWLQRFKEEEPIDILDFMDSSESTSFLDDMSSFPTLTSQDVQSIIPSFSTSNDNDFLVDNFFDSESKFDGFPENIFETSVYEPRIVQVNNYQEPNSTIEELIIKKEVQSDKENDEIQKDAEMEDIPYEIKYKCEMSLFKKSQRSQPTDKYPWELDFVSDQQIDDDFTGDKSIELISEYEENEIYKRLKAIFEAFQSEQINIPPWIRRHYRKLCVRRTQRSLGLPVFNVDKFGKVESKQNIDKTSNTAVLDRFHHLISSSGNFSTGTKSNETFMARLAGSCKYDLFVSPHTERILHPFIYRDDNCVPPMVQMLSELQYEVNGTMPNRASVDFCYVRPQHLAAVNALLQRLFWPGIDMSECLSYPDFSVVALYKKLVIGCAFLVPDVGHNEAYVSFMAVRYGWQRAGIATFMLYHLTQTCIGKDITLHVSATNPAICLYQKFGFKIQELILDFYDKYLPYDSLQSRHAFLLRLER